MDSGLLGLSEAIGNRYTACEILTNLGLLSHQKGDDASALDKPRQALALAQELGEEALTGFAYMGIARAEERLGRFEKAADAYQKALDLNPKSGWALPSMLQTS